MIFPNLPVADVAKAREFWTVLGFGFNESFSDDRAACLVINDLAPVMLLRQDFFHGFHDAAPRSGTETILAFDAPDRAGVDELCAKAAAAGATRTEWRMDDGPMYAGAFRDLDGHRWEVLHMGM
ncbi:VOC family protein [Tomitella cavernea]|uniref:Glyoxalase n=1 Tax=Tomitella cavernea TaxID=1387982 RepID=A0ABP9C4F2_9ACTN|nr:VOC family protein [Tomitella cavernea]